MRTLFSTSLLAVLLLGGRSALAQLSLSTAVDLAVHNSPKVKVAQADVDRAKAALQETRDVFIPSAGISGGIGKSTGPPLTVPQVFTVSAQSLIFNFSERDYLRAAHAGLAAAQLSLQEARVNVVEDVVKTYVALDNALQRNAAAQRALAEANRLGVIEQARFEAGADPHVEVTRARRTGLQIERLRLSTEDEIADDSEHLSDLVGIRLSGTDVVHDSIPPEFPQFAPARPGDSPALQSARANLSAKFYQARAQSRYLYRPQLSFGASYSYISTAFTNYDIYYRAFNQSTNANPNALSFGVQLQIPFVDFAHRARAREAKADVAHTQYELADAENTFREGNAKALRGEQQLALGVELARADRDLAQDELNAVLIQLQASAPSSGTGTPTAGATGALMSPRDEQNARLQVQQRTLDMLNAELELEQAEIVLLRQNGTLANWVHSAVSATALPQAPVASRP